MGIRSFIKRKVSEKLSNSDSSPRAPTPRPSPAPAQAPLPRDPDSEGFVAVLRESELEDGTGRTVAVNGQAIAVFNADGRYYAIDDACSHEDAPLGEGAVNGTTVACPYHDWIFDFTNGDCISFPDRPVGCFSAKSAEGFVWVGGRTRHGTDDRGGEHADGLTTSEHAS
jgi:nitrite reductase/ring-hydroxylating ferredoxin subunit